MEVDQICYKKNPIKSVIYRVDFLNPVEELNVALCPPFVEAIKDVYPIAEPREKLMQSIVFHSPENQETKTEKSQEWNFYNSTRKNKLTVDKNHLVISISDYHKFENLKDCIVKITDAFEECYPDNKSKRIGLRYINEIVFDEPNPLNWEDYINPNLISVFQFHDSKNEYSRAFQNLTLKKESHQIRFQYGMPNPDFPNQIKLKIFVLDYDAYSNSIANINDNKKIIDDLHFDIQQLFEKSITQNLREKFEYEQKES